MAGRTKAEMEATIKKIHSLYKQFRTGDKVLVHKAFCKRKDCNTCFKGNYSKKLKYDDDFWDF